LRQRAAESPSEKIIAMNPTSRPVPSWIGLAMLLGALVPHASVGAAPEVENLKRVLGYWENVWSRGQLEGVAQFYDPACKHGKNFTIEGFQKNVARFRAAFPDLTVTVNEIFATGDRVVCHVTYRATHSGAKFLGQEPMNTKIEVPGIDIFVLRDGKCVDHLHVADHLDLVVQMGMTLTPKPPEGPK
jgi:predicted ester cyclase